MDSKKPLTQIQKVNPYEVPFSVWGLIKTIVHPEELPVIQKSIGESLIEQCIDLRCEVETLLEIWKELNQTCGENKDALKKPLSNKILPESTQMKEMLKMEVKMLAANLNAKSSSLPQSLNATDLQTISYVMKNAVVERPSTPLRSVTDGAGASTSSPVRLKDVRRNINVCDVDRVVGILRDALIKEQESLENDVVFLQDSIEKSHQSESCNLFKSTPTGVLQEPSVNELKQARRNLENELFSNCKSKATTRLLSAPPKLARPKSVKHSKPIKEKQAVLNDKQLAKDNACEVKECWIEPDWTDAMNDHIDSEARPVTRDLSSVMRRLDSLKVCSSNVIHVPTVVDDKPIEAEPIKTIKRNSLSMSNEKKLLTKTVLVPKKPSIKPSLLTRRTPKTIPRSALAKT